MAFWLALVFGCLALAAVPQSPAIGIGLAVPFFGAAWGIRRREPWAAVMAAYLLLMPFFAQAVRWDPRWDLLALTGSVSVACAAIFLRAAKRMPAAASSFRRGWPWVAVITAFLAATFFLRPMMLPTASMANTMHAGDRFFVETVTAAMHLAPRRGDLIVFRYPVDRRQIFVKRIVGVPGDRIRIRDRQLYRNGAPVAEPYATHESSFTDAFRDNFPSPPQVALPAPGELMLARNVQDGDVVVPEGRYFVLGDNRDQSLDSRYWGFVARKDILGRPLVVYAPARGGRSIFLQHVKQVRGNMFACAC